MPSIIQNPITAFLDTDGTPLDNGSIYIGSTGQNPETSPITVYWDYAATQPAAQPIKTVNGQPARNGIPAVLFVTATNFSITVKSRLGKLVYSLADTTSVGTISAANGSSLIGFIQAGTGAVQRTAQDKMREYVSVKDFGAVGDGVADDTAAVQAALTACLRVFIPDGTYKITSTLVLRANQHIIGASTLGTVLQANTDITVMSATNISQVVLEDFEIFGIGKSTSTKYGMQWINTPYCVFNRIYVMGFSKGIYFKAGGTGQQSSFSNSINNCVIHYNTINIDAELNTNNLNLFSTRFGSASIGLRFLDSNTLMVFGGDCEGCTVAAIQVDAAVAATDVGVTITGTHFESNTSTSGDILIGGANRISGVHISGNLFYGGAGNATPLSMLYASGVMFAGNTVFGNYTSKNPTFGTVTNICIQGNHPIASIPNLVGGNVSFPATQVASTDPNTLDDYREGTWTPNQGAGLTVVGAFTSSGRYTKVGNLVTVTGVITGATSISFGAVATICTNLPFTTLNTGFNPGVRISSNGTGDGNVFAQGTTLTSGASGAAAGTWYFTVTYPV